MKQIVILATGLLWATLGMRSVSASEPEDTISCGEFCVQVACEFYDADYFREKALAILEPGEFGETSLEQVKQCLSAFGLESEGMKGTFDEVVKGQACPMVAFIKSGPTDPVGHFVLMFCESEQDALIVFDRLISDKPVIITKEAFTRRWTGVVLAVTPASSSRDSMVLPVGLVALGLVSLAFSFRRGRRPSGSATLALLVLTSLARGGLCMGVDNTPTNESPAQSRSRVSSSEQEEAEPIIVTQRSADLGTLKDIRNERDFCVVFRWTNESGKELAVSKVVPSP